jgi:hypothetical protein
MRAPLKPKEGFVATRRFALAHAVLACTFTPEQYNFDHLEMEKGTDGHGEGRGAVGEAGKQREPQ